MANLKIFKGKKPAGFENRPDIWEEEFRIKDLTTKKNNLIKNLTKGRELKEGI